MTAKRKGPWGRTNQTGQVKYSENALIFKALTKAARPLTRRELSRMTGLEISVLCRVLHHLVYFYPYTLKVSHYAACQTTGISVMHFTFTKPRSKEVQDVKG